jgi:hypothetical protein
MEPLFMPVGMPGIICLRGNILNSYQLVSVRRLRAAFNGGTV